MNHCSQKDKGGKQDGGEQHRPEDKQGGPCPIDFAGGYRLHIRRSPPAEHHDVQHGNEHQYHHAHPLTHTHDPQVTETSVPFLLIAVFHLSAHHSPRSFVSHGAKVSGVNICTKNLFIDLLTMHGIVNKCLKSSMFLQSPNFCTKGGKMR